MFRSIDSGAAEVEYLGLLASLVGVFKPTHLMETGTWNGDGTASLLTAADPGATVISICHHALSPEVQSGLIEIATERGSELHVVEANTIDIIHGRYREPWGAITGGNVTFAFLDSSIPDRAAEFEYISDPANGVLDFSRPLCVCIHDMSRYRHPDDADTGHLAQTVARLEATGDARGWQCVRYNQSRGMIVMIKYPDSSEDSRPRQGRPATVGAPWNINTDEIDLRAYSFDRGNFKDVRKENVLIYFPHGFGDFVFFSHTVLALDQTNRYWMTRYGDDYTSVLEGATRCQPLYLGYSSTHCGDGDTLGNTNLGLNYSSITGDIVRTAVPASFYNTCKKLDISTLLYSNLPEMYGFAKYPFHTKARYALSLLASQEQLTSVALDSPLKSCINFDNLGWVAKWVEAKLRSFTGFGPRKLCLINRNGYTSTGKNWGHLWREGEDGHDLPEGEECRQFMRLLLKKDPTWMFLVVEDRMFEGNDTVRSRENHCFSYAELFGTPDDISIPFGLIMKALVNLAELSIGVPAGVHHLCMVKQELPSVGLWIEHFPSWYDEPKEASIHVLSRNILDHGLDKRLGSFTKVDNLIYRTMQVDTRRIYGEAVLAAVEELLGI